MLRRTGVFATREQFTAIKALAETARATPIIALSSKDMLEGNDFASRAWGLVYATLNLAAQANGLSADISHGIDPANGEFMEDDEEYDMVADPWLRDDAEERATETIIVNPLEENLYG